MIPCARSSTSRAAVSRRPRRISAPAPLRIWRTCSAAERWRQLPFCAVSERNGSVSRGVSRKYNYLISLYKLMGAVDRSIDCAQDGRPSTGGGGKDGRSPHQPAIPMFVPPDAFPARRAFRSQGGDCANSTEPAAAGHVRLARGWTGRARIWGDGEPCRSSGANPMFGIFSVRLAGVGAVSLALFAAGLVSVPSFPTTGAGLPRTGLTVAVNRSHKADRLPVLGPAVRPELGSPAEPSLAAPLPAAPLHTRPLAQIPPGCDRAFSPISAPRLAHVFKRCIA